MRLRAPGTALIALAIALAACAPSQGGQASEATRASEAAAPASASDTAEQTAEPTAAPTSSASTAPTPEEYDY